jgi:hypothetical protein
MIGRWLDLLTTEEEDRLLTQPFGHVRQMGSGTGCLIQVAVDFAVPYDEEPRAESLATFGRRGHGWYSPMACVWGRYDEIRHRWMYDDARLNALIRNRILRNRARRALTPSPTSEQVVKAFTELRALIDKHGATPEPARDAP